MASKKAKMAKKQYENFASERDDTIKYIKDTIHSRVSGGAIKNKKDIKKTLMEARADLNQSDWIKKLALGEVRDEMKAATFGKIKEASSKWASTQAKPELGHGLGVRAPASMMASKSPGPEIHAPEQGAKALAPARAPVSKRARAPAPLPPRRLTNIYYP